MKKKEKKITFELTTEDAMAIGVLLCISDPKNEGNIAFQIFGKDAYDSIVHSDSFNRVHDMFHDKVSIEDFLNSKLMK